MAQAVYSRSVQKRVDELLAVSDKWAEGVRNRDGVRFVLFASTSRSDVFYMTRIDGEGCTCPAARLSRSSRCCHQIAAARHTQRVQAQAARPTKKYEDYYGNEDSF